MENGKNQDKFLEMWKKLSKPTFLQCQFVGQDVVRTFKKYGIKWNVVGKNGLKGDRLLTVTSGVSEEIEI